MINPKYLLTFFAFLVSCATFARQSMPEVADAEEGWMRSEGKIYVVGAVVLTILIGLIIYIVRLERKIVRLEKGKF